MVTFSLSQSYDVACASTFREAQSLISQGPYDLVLLDVTLPDGDYIVKPLNLVMLRARIDAVLRGVSLKKVPNEAIKRPDQTNAPLKP